MRTSTAAVLHQGSALDAAMPLSFLAVPEQSCERPYGTLGNLDERIQKPTQASW